MGMCCVEMKVVLVAVVMSVEMCVWVVFVVNLLDNCFKYPTALRKWEPQCGCTSCDTCVLRKFNV